MRITAWLVILPFAVASFATGIAQALLSAWGMRHYWVILKLALTGAATAVLLIKLGPIDALARSAAGSVGLDGLRMSLALHAAGGLAILVAAILLAIYKPEGLTKAGRRTYGMERGPAPAWVKACWVAAAGVALVLVAMAVVGNHGPGAHLHG